LAFASCFCFKFFLLALVLFSFPKATNVVFIINLFHIVKLESLFQNCKHSPLKLTTCGFQERFPSKILLIIYILKCD
jgi:hypothetical protein